MITHISDEVLAPDPFLVNARKMQEKREKNPKRETNARKCFYITLVLGKNAGQLRLGHVLVAFWSRFGHKPYQNANPTHSVIWP